MPPAAGRRAVCRIARIAPCPQDRSILKHLLGGLCRWHLEELPRGRARGQGDRGRGRQGKGKGGGAAGEGEARGRGGCADAAQAEEQRTPPVLHRPWACLLAGCLAFPDNGVQTDAAVLMLLARVAATPFTTKQLLHLGAEAHLQECRRAKAPELHGLVDSMLALLLAAPPLTVRVCACVLCSCSTGVDTFVVHITARESCDAVRTVFNGTCCTHLLGWVRVGAALMASFLAVPGLVPLAANAGGCRLNAQLWCATASRWWLGGSRFGPVHRPATMGELAHPAEGADHARRGAAECGSASQRTARLHMVPGGPQHSPCTRLRAGRIALQDTPLGHQPGGTGHT